MPYHHHPPPSQPESVIVFTNCCLLRVLSYPAPGRVSRADVDQAVSQAFAMWEEVTGLTFQRLDRGKVHIEIRFDRYEHGDGDPFVSLLKES